MAQDVKTCTASGGLHGAAGGDQLKNLHLSAASTAQQPPLPLVRNDLLWPISAQHPRLS